MSDKDVQNNGCHWAIIVYTLPIAFLIRNIFDNMFGKAVFILWGLLYFAYVLKWVVIILFRLIYSMFHR